MCVFVLFLENADSAVKPYQFKMEEIEGFRYRCRVSDTISMDVLCSEGK